MRVVEEVAAIKNVDPVDLQEPLSDAVDPDALDSLFAGRNGNGRSVEEYASFVYNGCRVTVNGDGSVTATELNR